MIICHSLGISDGGSSHIFRDIFVDKTSRITELGIIPLGYSIHLGMWSESMKSSPVTSAFSGINEITCCSFKNVELKPICDIISDTLAANHLKWMAKRPSSQTCALVVFWFHLSELAWQKLPLSVSMHMPILPSGDSREEASEKILKCFGGKIRKRETQVFRWSEVLSSD